MAMDGFRWFAAEEVRFFHHLVLHSSNLTFKLNGIKIVL